MENNTVELLYTFDSMEEMQEVFGNLDANIHQIEQQSGAVIVARENEAVIRGSYAQC